MDNLTKFEMQEKYLDRIIELFKNLAEDDPAIARLYDRWADTFEIEMADEKQVNVIYNGEQDIKIFKKECTDTLTTVIYSVLGERKKIKITEKRVETTTFSPKVKKNVRAVKFFVLGMIFVCIATAVIIVLGNYIGNRNFRETFYITSSIKVDSNIRVVQLSDLHGTSYGKNNKDLLKRVKDLKPNVIILTGDIVDSVEDDTDYAVALAEELAKIAPSYYIYGNNEVEGVYDIPLNQEELDAKFGFDSTNRDETALLKLSDPFEEALENVGVKVLKNEKDTITIGTMTVDVYGVLTSNPSSFWTYTEKSFADYISTNTDNIKLTAIHEPFIFEEFQTDYWGDLMLCGHTHGGVVRVPVLGPLYTREGGLFPERGGDFVYGRYNVAGRPLIVSGGLENSNVLRINNQPELVIIDINKF